MIALENIPLSFLYDVPNAPQHKNNIMGLIQKIPPNPYEAISHTDFNLPGDFYREYASYFLNNIYKQFEQEFLKYLNETSVKNWKTVMVLNNMWFQWYNQNDYHTWHVHPRCHFTNIYFLKNTSPSLGTQIRFCKKEYKVEVKEGQILTIPSFYLHQSPLNTLKEPKVIISFNTTITGDK